METKSPTIKSKKSKIIFNEDLLVPRSKSDTRLDRFLKRKDKLKSNLNKLVNILDTFTNARTTIFFVVIFYTLGRGLNSFVYTILGIYLYLLTYRLIRFWVNKSLMFMLDFVYFGNVFLIYFLLFQKKNEDYFIALFSISNGVIALTNLDQKNKVDLGDSDFSINTFLDSVPALATSAIRWRHKIYNVDFDNFINFDYVPMKNDKTLWKIILMPIWLWFIWALGYLVLNGKILKKFAYSHLYESSIYTFYHSDKLSIILGDHKKYTIIKYLCTQLLLLIVSIPIVINCFYNPYFNLFFVFFINLVLGFNTARAKNEELKKMVKNV